MSCLILTAASLRLWAAQATPGAVCVYHVGALASDRGADPIADRLASLALAMSEAGLLVLVNARIAIGGMTAYTARLARRDADHPLVTGLLTPREWAALRALRDREERVSAERHVARSIGIAEAEARVTLDGLRARGWVVLQPSERGPMQTAPSPLAVRYVGH